MMSLTADGQLDEAKLAKRDADMGVDTAAKRAARQHLVPTDGRMVRDDGADMPWKTNRGIEVRWLSALLICGALGQA